MKKLGSLIYLLTILFALVIYGGAMAQEQPKKEDAAPPPPAPVFPEKSYDIPYDTLWDKIIEMLKAKQLYTHAHGKAAEDKENGKITTQTFRYFSIIQASSPVIELDYSDQYIISVIKPPEPKKEEPKAEPAKDPKADAASKNPAEPDKKAEAPAEKPAEATPAEPEPPKGPPLIRVQIERKFLKHNGLPNPQGAWVSADPKQENNVGISEDTLFNDLDLLIASLPKSGAAPASTAPAAAPASTTSAPVGK